jgi:hypothetical protein
VELAFALPLLIMLLVGMVSAGIAYNHQLALTHAAREGGRYAATLPVNEGAMNDWLETVADQVIADATGSLDDGVDGRYVCVAFVYPSGGETASLTIGDGGPSDTEACIPDDDEDNPGDGRPDSERRVQVVVGRDANFSVVFWSAVLNLDARAVNRFEAAQ